MVCCVPGWIGRRLGRGKRIVIRSRKDEEEAGKQGAAWPRTDTLTDFGVASLGWPAIYKGTEPDQADVWKSGEYGLCPEKL